MSIIEQGNNVPSYGIFRYAGTPTSGGSGTFVGVALPGALLLDTTNKVHYVNTNTQASPTWTLARRITQGANIAVLGATSDLVGVDGAGSNAAPLVGTEARLDAIEAKLDAVITALVTAGVLAAA
jgi:hypothetical protein